MSKTSKRDRRPRRDRSQILREVVLALKAAPGSSAADVGVTMAQMAMFVKDGMVVKDGTRKHADSDGKARRGRPVTTFKLTRKGSQTARELEAA